MQMLILFFVLYTDCEGKMRKTMSKMLLVYCIVIYVHTLQAQGVDENVKYVRRNSKWFIETEKGLVGISSKTIIIKFKESVSNSAIDEFNSKNGISIIKKLKDELYVLSINRNENIIDIINEYDKSDIVQSVMPDYYFEVASTPNDSLYSLQEYLSCINDSNDIDAQEAWGIETGDSTIVVAIIDSGVDIDHPDLIDNVRANLSCDFVGDYDTEVGAFRNHGTMIAGIVSADMNNSIGVSSVAGGWENYSGVKLMCLACGASENALLSSSVYAAFDYAIENGADVINCSFVTSLPSSYFQSRIDSCYAHNIVVVAARGDWDNTTEYYPAGYNHVISVGSCMDTYKIPGSNFGGMLDVVAPSGNSPLSGYTPVYTTKNNNTYGWGCQTSCSAPQVSGLAALLFSYDPSLTVDEITQIICESTVKYSNHTFSDYGWGTAPYGSWDDSLGYGQINAYKALFTLKGYGELATDVTWYNDLEFKGNVTIPAGKTMTVEENVTIYVPAGDSIVVNGTLYLKSGASIRKVDGGNNWGNLVVQPGGSLITDSGATIRDCASVKLYVEPTINGTLHLGPDVDVEIYDTLTLASGTSLSSISGQDNWGDLVLQSGGTLITENGATIRDCSSVKLYEELTIQDTLYLGPDVDVEIYDSLVLNPNAVITKVPNEGNWGYLNVNAGGVLNTNATAYTISNYKGMRVYANGAANMLKDVTIASGDSLLVSGNLNMAAGKNITVNGTLSLGSGAVLTNVPGGGEWGYLNINSGGTLNKISTTDTLSNYAGMRVYTNGTVNSQSDIIVNSGDSLIVVGTINMGASDSLNVYGTLTLGGTIQKISSGNNWSNLYLRSGGSLVTDSGATIKDCSSVKLYEEPTIQDTLYLGPDVDVEVYDTFTLKPGMFLRSIDGYGRWDDMIVRPGATLTIRNGARLQTCNKLSLYEATTIDSSFTLGHDVSICVYDTLTMNSGASISKVPGDSDWDEITFYSGGTLDANGAVSISDGYGLIIEGNITLDNTLQLGPDVNVDVYGHLSLLGGSYLTKKSGYDNWGDVYVSTNGSLSMVAGSTIEYGTSILSVGSLGFPSGQTCHIQHMTYGFNVWQFSPMVTSLHFDYNGNGFCIASENGWGAFYQNTVSNGSGLGVGVSGNSGLTLLISKIETITGPCAWIDGTDATLNLMENNNSLIPYEGNLALDNPPGKVVWAERNYWGQVPEDEYEAEAYFADIITNPNVVHYALWLDEPCGGAEKRAIEEQQRLALSGILRSYCEGNWESAQENLYAFIGQTDNADQKREAICTLLQIVKDHGLDGSRVRGVIEKELLTAKAKYRAALDYLWCDSFMYEGKYEQAFKEFSTKAAIYKGTSREGDMLAKMAVITADCFRDEARALEYVNMAKALNPGQPSLRGAFRAVGVSYDPKQFTNRFEGVAEDFDKLGEPIEQKPLEQEVAEEFLTLSPNPFNPVTMFNYSIKENARVKLTVYSITGQKVVTLVDSPMAAGAHSVVFDGSNLASGIYLYRFESPGFIKTGKMLMVK
jgi:subtilisin family serine protease